MIIYNVTIKVDWLIHDDWLNWIKTEHIPEAMRSGLFSHYQLVKLLRLDDSEGPTYAVQYYSETMDNCNRYIAEFSLSHMKKAVAKWGNRFVDFSTLMEVVN